MDKKPLHCFKTYDIRGRIGSELNQDVSYRIGRSVAEVLQAKNIVVGYDARETSPDFSRSVSDGICDFGSNVIDIGLSGTEEVYRAVTKLRACAGIEITASHNPIDYNGMKIIKSRSRPLETEELYAIKNCAEENKFSESSSRGSIYDMRSRSKLDYIKKILSFVDINNLKPLKIVINSGNGAAGPIINLLEKTFETKFIKTEFIKINNDPDPSFPHGIPNPLLEENRSITSKAVKSNFADFGVAFDGDFDRCFFFDNNGDFVHSQYLIGILAEIFLLKEPGSTIVHDPRVIWDTIDVIENLGGKAHLCKTGHAFVKGAMRKFDAIYGGEMSAHHYFRDFSYCDSGMLPWLLIWELLSKSDASLRDLVYKRLANFPSSGEINFNVHNPSKCIETIRDKFSSAACKIEYIDGLSMSFEDWRFNLRKSNTEPLVRLNIETKGNMNLLQFKVKELTKLISSL